MGKIDGYLAELYANTKNITREELELELEQDKSLYHEIRLKIDLIREEYFMKLVNIDESSKKIEETVKMILGHKVLAEELTELSRTFLFARE